MKYKRPEEDEDDEVIETTETEVVEKETSTEDESWKKRYSDLRSWSDKEINKLKADYKNMQLQLAATAEKNSIPATEDEVREWMEKYPLVGKIVESIAMKKVASAKEETNSKFEELEGELKKARLKEAYAMLLRAHPDFEDLKKSTDFQDWIEYEASDSSKRALYDGEDWKAARDAINAYKAEKNIAGSKPSKTNSAAASIKTSSSVTPTSGSTKYKFSESEIEQKSKVPGWFDKNEDAIMDALRKGEVLMDLSK